MEKSGSITKYYPFLGLNVKKFVENELEQSKTFKDFVTRLVTHVCSEKTTDNLFLYFIMKVIVAADTSNATEPCVMVKVIVLPSPSLSLI